MFVILGTGISYACIREPKTRFRLSGTRRAAHPGCWCTPRRTSTSAGRRCSPWFPAPPLRTGWSWSTSRCSELRAGHIQGKCRSESREPIHTSRSLRGCRRQKHLKKYNSYLYDGRRECSLKFLRGRGRSCGEWSRLQLTVFTVDICHTPHATYPTARVGRWSTVAPAILARLNPLV